MGGEGGFVNEVEAQSTGTLKKRGCGSFALLSFYPLTHLTG
jgi:hypothetical protein